MIYVYKFRVNLNYINTLKYKVNMNLNVDQNQVHKPNQKNLSYYK